MEAQIMTPCIQKTLIRLALFSIFSTTLVSQVFAENVAPIAVQWTPVTLQQAMGKIPVGDPVRGAEVHKDFFCASCHGDKGVSPSLNWPHLASQKASYTAKMMLDYQRALRLEGRRAALMRDIALMLTPQQISDVAAFYAQQTAPRDEETPRPQAEKGEKDVDARQLVRKGDRDRLITPCASCHGASGQGGLREVPSLAGQNPLYFVSTLLDYQSGVRNNDNVKGMRFFAAKLSRSEIEMLAAYYADLGLHK